MRTLLLWALLLTATASPAKDSGLAYVSSE